MTVPDDDGAREAPPCAHVARARAAGWPGQGPARVASAETKPRAQDGTDDRARAVAVEAEGAKKAGRPKAHPSGGRKPLPQPPRSICATPSSVSSHPPAPGLQGRGGSPTRPAIPGEISDPRPATFV